MRPREYDISYNLQNAEAVHYCQRELRFWSLEMVNVGYQAAGYEVEYWIDRIKTLEAQADANKMENTE